MSNLEKLNDVFCDVFSVDSSALGKGFDNQSIDGWDSVHQLNLTTSIEEAFNILLDPEDILEVTSYENAKKILAKYIIEL